MLKVEMRTLVQKTRRVVDCADGRVEHSDLCELLANMFDLWEDNMFPIWLSRVVEGVMRDWSDRVPEDKI